MRHASRIKKWILRAHERTSAERARLPACAATSRRQRTKNCQALFEKLTTRKDTTRIDMGRCPRRRGEDERSAGRELRAEGRAGERQRMHNELSTQQQWARGSERSAAAPRMRLKEWGEFHYEANELHENQGHSFGGTPVSAPTIGLSPDPGRFKVVGLCAPATTTTCHSRRAPRPADHRIPALQRAGGGS